MTSGLCSSLAHTNEIDFTIVSRLLKVKSRGIVYEMTVNRNAPYSAGCDS